MKKIISLLIIMSSIASSYDPGLKNVRPVRPIDAVVHNMKYPNVLDGGIDIRHYRAKTFFKHIRDIGEAYGNKSKGTDVLFENQQHVVAFKLPCYLRHEINENNKIWLTFCTGSILSDNKIITSANCFVKSVYVTVIGTKRFRLRGKFEHVRVVSKNAVSADHVPSNVHGDYRSITSVLHRKAYMYPYYDVAIVTVNGSYEFPQDIRSSLSNSVYYIHLAYPDFHKRESCWTVGFSTYLNDQYAHALAKVSVELTDCHRTLGGSIRSDYLGNYICAQLEKYNEKTTVDSGSPLMCPMNAKLLSYQSFDKPFALVGILSGIYKAPDETMAFTYTYREEITDLFSIFSIVGPSSTTEA